MRDPARIPEIVDLLQRVWEQNPDLRLGQLILGVAGTDDAFQMEEGKWKMRLQSRLEKGPQSKEGHMSEVQNAEQDPGQS